MAHNIDWSRLEPLSSLIEGLPEGARRSSRLMHVPGSSYLFRGGDKPAGLYFVISGDVRLTRQSRRGATIVLQRSRRGFIAEASLSQPAYRCDAVVSEPSELLLINRHAFQAALADDGYRAKWLNHLTRELHHVRALAERLSLKSAEERIVHFLETEGTDGAVTMQCTKKEWAAELGLSHEALYRTLARMERCGAIEIDGSRIRLLRTGKAQSLR
jgi:CRP-like cAMP-binding protein